MRTKVEYALRAQFFSLPQLGAMKPELPECVKGIFPREVVERINSFVPHLPKKPSSPKRPCSYSPELEKSLRSLQNSFLKGKSEMYLRDLDDFLL
jgi:hypothetical protein